MSFLKRLFSSNTPEPTQRTRICVECGMPVADHKDWCSIRRGHAEMERRKAEGQESGARRLAARLGRAATQAAVSAAAA
jgi:hypothetical protein